MVKVEASEYDGNAANGGGNGYLTKRSQDSSGAWSGGVGDRVTTYQYDYRGRAIVMAPPWRRTASPSTTTPTRTIATAQYS